MRILSAFLALFILSPAVTENAPRTKYAALTFDDGPHPVYTRQILKILYDYGVPATFFVAGENAERYPELLRAEYDCGHDIGNHTYSHPRITENGADKIIEDIKHADGVIYSVLGIKPSLFRPPEGRRVKTLDDFIKKSGKTEIFWTIDTRDWAHTEAEKITENIKTNIKDGSVILFHDYVTPPSPTPAVLEKIIPYLLSNGYKLVTVSELLTHKAYIGGKSSFFIG